MRDWLLKLLGLYKTEEEKEMAEAIDNKIKQLEKHGGKIIVSERGGLRHHFPSRENESAYWSEVLESIIKKSDKGL
ncbi:hypothetical protein VP249E411_P0042 [Vibrio phage 249E41-1]|nr:hypothetical protein VP249E411_P0042 [Vibrio phage 249E41-1]